MYPSCRRKCALVFTFDTQDMLKLLKYSISRREVSCSSIQAHLDIYKKLSNYDILQEVRNYRLWPCVYFNVKNLFIHQIMRKWTSCKKYQLRSTEICCMRCFILFFKETLFKDWVLWIIIKNASRGHFIYVYICIIQHEESWIPLEKNIWDLQGHMFLGR